MDSEVAQSIEMPTAAAPVDTDATYVTIYKDGLPWPVVLCDDTIPPKKFIAMRHNDDEIAAILLGKRKYIWVFADNADLFDPHVDYLEGREPFKKHDLDLMKGDDEATRTEKQRQSGFVYDAPAFQKAAYWANVIVQTAEAQQSERIRRGEKRKSSSRKPSSYSPVYGGSISESDDEKPEIKKSKVTSTLPSSSSLSSNDETVFGRKGHPSTPKDTPASKPTVYELSSNVKVEEDSDDEDVDLENFEGPPKLTAAEKDRLMLAYQAPRNNKSCIIVVGKKENCPMHVNRRFVEDCEHLRKRIKKNSQDLYFIDLTSMDDITAKSFIPVFDYLRTAKIGPELYGEPPRASDQDLEPNRKAYWAEYLGRAFITAHKIQHITLQSIVYKKLCGIYPLEPMSLLTLAFLMRSIQGEYNEVETDMRIWMADYLTECYWMIARDHISSLQRLLENDDDMRNRVYQALVNDGQAGKSGFIDED